MFTDYFEEMTRQREAERAAAAAASSAAAAANSTSKTTKRRKFSPVVDAHNNESRLMAEDADMLHDIAHAEMRDVDSDDEAHTRGPVVKQPFRLTDQLPHFSVGDIFSTRDFFREVLQQYGVMSKRPVHIKVNDDTRLRIVCRGADGECPWFVYIIRKKMDTTWCNH